jgi:hypothetical protein
MKKMFRIMRADFLSPKYLLLRAVALALFFLIVEVAGLREYSTFLSGTVPFPGVNMKLASFYGMLYLACYVGFVVVAPILLLAAGMLTVWGKISKKLQHEP